MNTKKFMQFIGAGVLATSLLLSGCSTVQEKSSEMPRVSAAVSTDIINTKNTTRIPGQNAEELAISTSKMIWPATKAGTAPNVVLIAPKGDWQIQLAGLDLVHHPSDGPLLITERDEISKPVMDELMRLNPKGAEDGTQVITLGMDEKAVEAISNHFQVTEIKGENPYQIAAAIDAYYAEVSGSLPTTVIVSTSEAAEFAVPAGNWISHMPEPLLYVNGNEVPLETQEALQKREGNATVYLLGPESIISEKVEGELAEFGKVIRIAGEDPISNALAFAKYKDPQTGFGWGVTQPGHGLLLGSVDSVHDIIPTAPFAHRGKHAPLLLSEGQQAPASLLAYLQELKPLFEKEPTEGPYNHLYIVGGTDWISWEQQGDLDHLIEIESASGDSHGAHGTGEPVPSKEEQQATNHNGHH